MNSFLFGAVAMASFVAALFFLLVAWLLLNAYGLFRRPGGA